MHINLYGSNGQRSLKINTPQTAHSIVDTKEHQHLSPLTLQTVIDGLPRRFYNMDELVTQLSQIHGISVSTATVAKSVASCELEVKGIGTEQQVRRHDDGESIQHQKASFAAARKLTTPLQKFEIDQDTLWEWVKKEYNVESRTQLDPYQWATLSAEFNSALRDHEMLKILARRIKDKQ